MTWKLKFQIFLCDACGIDWRVFLIDSSSSYIFGKINYYSLSNFSIPSALPFLLKLIPFPYFLLLDNLITFTFSFITFFSPYLFIKFYSEGRFAFYLTLFRRSILPNTSWRLDRCSERFWILSLYLGLYVFCSEEFCIISNPINSLSYVESKDKAIYLVFFSWDGPFLAAIYFGS